MADLNDLLARLKMPAASGSPGAQGIFNGQQAPLHHPQPQTNYQQPFVSSPITSPPVGSPQPQSLSSLAQGLAPSTPTPAQGVASDRTANLLNLLRFNQPSASMDTISQQSQSLRDKSGARAVSASPFMANFAHAASSSGIRDEARQVSLGLPTQTSRQGANGNPQDLLLKLLNRPQPAGIEGKITSVTEPVDTEPVDTELVDTEPVDTEAVDVEIKIEEEDLVDPSEREATPVRVFGAQHEEEKTSFEAPSQSNKSSIFSYVNPFEQLAASSPRNKTPKPEGRSNDAASVRPTSSNLGNIGSHVASQIPAGRSHVESLLGIGSNEGPRETVSHALGEISNQVDQEARHAVARAEESQDVAADVSIKIEAELDRMESKGIKEAVHDAAVGLKEELKTVGGRAMFEKGVPKRVAKAFEDSNDMKPQEVADSWESADADGSSEKDDADSGVSVYKFPMRPFVAIDVVNLPLAGSLRNDIIMKIASLKKEFDQVDRTLASATTNFIVYTMSKGGGLRIIRQDDGNNKQVFRHADNRIFNVNISSSVGSAASATAETILATGVNGSVYWTTVSLSTPDAFDDEDLDKKGFIFPPLPSSEENTSGGPLKTRAKQSSRHPEFFAIGRGKAIHIVWPSLATLPQYIDQKTRVVDTEKYLAERCLKIGTGKAGKDFTFSADDTVLVSLDKAGRVKFWDIREHTNAAVAAQPDSYRHVEVKTPLLTLATSSPTEKSWATSVQLLDKERPTMKGVALRYLLVGSKQNHTLQLWDLGLGKPVQELNFPHENETDAICSIAYHPKTGIVVVGHPTRNSIFLIHLSAPRYHLPNITQADYISRLAIKDKTLPAPESTAIMSGIREISLTSIGKLRSLDINNPLPPNGLAGEKPAPDEETLLEAYVLHSRGVTCLNLKRPEFGWDKHGKDLKPVDAAEKNIIEVNDLRMLLSVGDVVEASETSSKPADAPGKATELKTEPKTQAKDARATTSPTKPVSKASTGEKSLHVGSLPVEAPKEAAKPAASQEPASENIRPPLPKIKSASKVPDVAAAPSKETTTDKKAPETFATIAQRGANGPTAPVQQSQPTTGNQFNAVMLGETIAKALSNTLSNVFAQVLGDQLENLYKRFDDEKRVHAAAGAAKQDAVLRLISSTLGDNVDRTLTRIVTTNIEQSVIPALTSTIAEKLDKRVTDTVTQQLQMTVPREIRAALEAPIARAMQDPEVLRIIADLVSSKVAKQVDAVFSSALTKTIAPAFEDLAVSTALKSSAAVEERVMKEIRHVEAQNKDANAKIDQLTNISMEMLEAVRSMTQTLATSQEEILSLKQQLAERSAPAAQAASEPAAPVAPKDEELESISASMAGGMTEEATIKWLQSARRVELFDLFFVRKSPAYLAGVDQLITLSVAAAVTDALETNLPHRLGWLEAALDALDPYDPVVAENATNVMDALVQRLSNAYMVISEDEPIHPLLSKIGVLVRQARNIKAAAIRRR